MQLLIEYSDRANLFLIFITRKKFWIETIIQADVYNDINVVRYRRLMIHILVVKIYMIAATNQRTLLVALRYNMTRPKLSDN